MKVIGITGGVGSGKSTISKIMKDNFETFLINTDEIAHNLMQKGNVSYNLIVSFFGREILDEKEEIDRSKLSKIVYSDKDLLLKLNSFTHLYVMDFVKKLIKENKERYSYVCVETALPIEAKLSEICDEVWYIYVPEEVRKERLKKSRNYSDEKISKIFSKQLSEKEFRNICTHEIDNNCSEDETLEKIKLLLKGNYCINKLKI